ncbi:Cthe_2314 family HEPN domain-containing protein [Burkholderia gladioli]|uniref:Cthe_2314 family HEPN domain-containing protein n=1 Tax=Burkholderia gladioli TaxID=28095 RepID=UPI001640F726|nr:Cthe_2314 family HEPN domain-containing protein [Burkholderia gladioli]
MDINQFKMTPLIEHEALRPLMPFLQSYLHKVLTARRGEEKPRVTPIEFYAEMVAERIGELDNSMNALRMCASFIQQLSDSAQVDTNAYQYHYENFVFRVIGVDDRAYRLVGASMGMSRQQIERTKGKVAIERRVREVDGAILEALNGVTEVVKVFRKPRNELVHNSAFRTREIGLFHAVRELSIPVEGYDVDALAREYFLSESEGVDLKIIAVQASLEKLLSELASSYSAMAEPT